MYHTQYHIMPQTITMTELLRNPKKVRALVKQGIKVYVLFEGEVAMVINLPDNLHSTKQTKKLSKSKQLPSLNLGLGDKLISRDDIYGENSWLDK